MRTSSNDERQQLRDQLKVPFEQTAAGTFVPDRPTPDSSGAFGESPKDGTVRLGGLPEE